MENFDYFPFSKISLKVGTILFATPSIFAGVVWQILFSIVTHKKYSKDDKSGNLTGHVTLPLLEITLFGNISAKYSPTILAWCGGAPAC